MSLYYGDSSDDEDAYPKYSTKNLNDKASKLYKNNKIEYLSSFIFEEVAQSILEHPKVVNAYRLLKADAHKQLSEEDKNNIKEYDSQIHNKYLFGQHLKNNFQKENANMKIYQDLSKVLKDQIEDKTQALALILNDFEAQRQQIDPSNYAETQKLYQKYFFHSDVIGEFKNHFNNKKKEVIDLLASLDYTNIKLTQDHVTILEDYLNCANQAEFKTKSLAQYFQNDFTTVYLGSLTFETKRKPEYANYFLHGLFDNTGLSLEDYRTYLYGMLNFFGRKKIKAGTSEDSGETYRTLAVRVWLNDQNVKNQAINKNLIDKRPNSFFSENCDEFLGKMKFDQKIIRSFVKEIGITAHRTGNLIHKLKYPEATTFLRTSVTKNAVRTDYRELSLKNTSTTYRQVVQNELNLQDGNIGIEFKEVVKKIVHAQPVSKEEKERVLTDLKDYEFLCQFVDMLFCGESERNISALLTNIIFIDLVANGVYSLKDLPNYLPMAVKKDDHNQAGAVQGARFMLDLLGGEYSEESPYLTKRQYYDFGAADEFKSREIAARETALLVEWLAFQKLLSKEEIITHKKINGKKPNENEDSNMKVADAINVLCGAGHYLHQMQKPNMKSGVTNFDSLLKSINQYIFDTFKDMGTGDFHFETLAQSLHKLILDWYNISLDYLHKEGEEEIHSS